MQNATRNKGGRPTKCTLELAEAIGAMVVRGASIKHAAEAQGVPRSLVYDWMEKGKAPDNEPYTGFSDTLRQLLAQAQAEAEIRVYEGRKGWRGAVRWLEAKDPDTWRRTERRDLSHRMTGADITIPFPDIVKPGIEGAKAAARASASAGQDAARRARQALEDALAAGPDGAAAAQRNAEADQQAVAAEVGAA